MDEEFETEHVKHSLLGRELVEFCPHALKQMKVRGINKKEVIGAVEHPDKVGLNCPADRERVRRFKKKTKAIDVVYKLKKDRVLIITALFKTFPARR